MRRDDEIERRGIGRTRMFRKKFSSRSRSKPAAPGPREVPAPEPVPAAPSDPALPSGAPSALKDPGAPSALKDPGAPSALKDPGAPSALKDIVAPRRLGADGLPSSAGHTLVVGRDIVLSGEIETCDKLIVEGQVEGEIIDTRRLEIAETGRFKGRAEVEVCVVSGACEGEITVAGLLTVRPQGRIKGTVRYAEIEMQRGGRLSGEVEILTVRAVPDPAPTESHADAPDAPTAGQKPGPG